MCVYKYYVYLSDYAHLKVRLATQILSLVSQYESERKKYQNQCKSRHILTAFVWSLLWPSFVIRSLSLYGFIQPALCTLVLGYSATVFYVFLSVVKFVSFIFIGSSSILGLCKV